jgi:hypothetical protein
MLTSDYSAAGADAREFQLDSAPQTSYEMPVFQALQNFSDPFQPRA